MRYLVYFSLITIFAGCFGKRNYNYPPPTVWGSKPVYGSDSTLKKITYSPTPASVTNAGNIYVKGNYLYQVETGRGIHIIDNTVPSNAARIGFVSINGCSQISIQGAILYSNNYDDLVIINISDLQNIKEVARTKNAFPSGRMYYPNSEPAESGYYQCPSYDSLVVSWVKDSIPSSCYKN